MATIETKYVDVGFFDGQTKFPDQYGFSSPISIGTLSNTANGSSDPDVSGIYSSVDCIQVVWFDTNTLQFAVEGVRSNSGWDSMTVGSTTVNRSDASFTTSSAGNGSTTWTWSSQSNPFGTTVGADVLVTWDDGAAAIVAPTISSVTNNNASAANVTATVNLSSNGSGGTLKYAQTTSNSVPASGWQTGNTFSHPRGTTRYYWASQDEDTSGAFSSSTSHAVGYLTGDTAVSATSSTIANDASSAATTVSGGQSAETYAVRVNNGATNLGTRTGNGSISFSSSLPSGGNTTTYEIFVRRPTSTGGDGSTFTATNDTFTVTRTAADGSPNAFTFTDVTNVARSTTQTSNQITISGINTSVAVSITGGTYSKNGGSYTSSAGTAVNGDTFTVRHTSSSSYSTAVNTTLTVGGVSDTYTSTTLAAPTYSINAPASINEGSAGTINVTTTNVANGTTLYWDVDQTTDYATSQGSVSISSNAGSFTITPTADSTTEGAETDTIRLYSDSGRTTEVANDSFTINDTSTGGGGSVGGSDGNVDYGIEVTGPNGTTKVFGVNLRQINAIVLASVTLAQGGSVSYTGIANATDATKVAVALFPGTPGFFQVSGTTVSRSAANGGTITLTNAAPFSLAIKVSIYRIA